MSLNRILQFGVVYRKEIDSVHRSRIDLELPYLRPVHKDTRQIESNRRKGVEIDETRLKVTSLVGGSQAAGRSHNSDLHVIISYSWCNDARRKSWSIFRSFFYPLHPGLIGRTSFLFSRLRCCCVSLQCPTICLFFFLMLTWNYSTHSQSWVTFFITIYTYMNSRDIKMFLRRIYL